MSLFGGTTVPVRSLLFVVIMFACTHMRTTTRAQRSRCSHEGHQTHADTPREMPSGAHSLSVVSSVATPPSPSFPKILTKFPRRPRRGPALSGVCLGIRTDFSQTRGSVPIADRQSVHCVPVIVRALGHIKAEGTHKERPQTRIALAQERYTSAATETSSA